MKHFKRNFLVSLLAGFLLLVVYSYSSPLKNETSDSHLLNNKDHILISPVPLETTNTTNVSTKEDKSMNTIRTKGTDNKGAENARNVESETTETTDKVSEVTTKAPRKMNQIRIDDGILPDSQDVLTDEDVLITVKTGRLFKS